MLGKKGDVICISAARIRLCDGAVRATQKGKDAHSIMSVNFLQKYNRGSHQTKFRYFEPAGGTDCADGYLECAHRRWRGRGGCQARVVLRWSRTSGWYI